MTSALLRKGRQAATGMSFPDEGTQASDSAIDHGVDSDVDSLDSPVDTLQGLSQSSEALTLPVTIPQNIDPSTIPSMVNAIEKAFVVMSRAGLLHRADRLAELATGFVEPSTELVEERIHRMKTIQEVFTQGEWLTAEQLNALQPSPPANKAHPASDWKRRDRVFSVNYGGREYFARYQFDALYQPLPIIKSVLALFGEVADSWTLAAWFHFPSAWLVRRDENSAVNIAPKDSLDRREELMRAASNRLGSYTA